MSDILQRLTELAAKGAELPNHLTRDDQARIMQGETPTKRGKYNNNAGRRPDLRDIFFRSSMEANAARWLIYNGYTLWDGKGDKPSGKHIRYEGRQFKLTSPRGKVYAYKVDFEMWPCAFTNAPYGLLELKGHLTPQAKTKLGLMGKQYPDIPLTVITYSGFKTWTRGVEMVVPNWE